MNVFFLAEGTGKDAHFKYEDYVQKWLDLIRGSYLETSVDELKLGAQKPPMPFSDTSAERPVSYAVVHAERSIVLCDGKSVGTEAECFLSRL